MSQDTNTNQALETMMIKHLIAIRKLREDLNKKKRPESK